jgi:hypothetical protein
MSRRISTPWRAFAATIAVALVMLWPAKATSAETLDRIAVTVNRHVITASDVLLDVRISAFLDRKAPDLSGSSRRKAAERLVDLYMVLEDATVTRAPQPSMADIGPLLEPIRARYASDAEFHAELEKAGISEAQLKDHLLAGLRMMRYTDLRFRPEVPITEQDLHGAYAELTARRPGGQPAPSFEASRAQLEEFVVNRRVLEALDRWLTMTRGETQILFRDAAFR